MNTVELPAFAKINLTLSVTGRRPDGYHEIVSVMQAVDLHDDVTVSLRADGEIRLQVPDGKFVPEDSRNTAYKAAAAFLKYAGRTDGADIVIQKRIPVRAGLGGGSADAAAVLVGLNQLLETGYTAERLCEIGAAVGTDVPFCILGGAAVATGIGADLRPLPSLPDCSIVVAQPFGNGVSTGEAYARIDAAQSLPPIDQFGMRAAIEKGDLPAVGRRLGNDFEAAFRLPEAAELRQIMDEFRPLGSQMTGSGSAVFAIFSESTTAAACAEKLRQTASEVFVCKPIPPR